MKKLPIAAAALLFGTSAYAMVPSTEPTGVRADKDAYTVTGTTAVDTVAEDSARLQPASADWWTAEPVAYTADDTGADLKAVAETSEDVTAAEADAADAALAAAEKDAEATADVAESQPALEPAVAEVEPASYETTAVDEAPAPVEAADDSGVGGPYEGVDPMAADLTPRPAAANYPACRPGPGDDRCIQLYEPGVHQQLASWSQPTGGFAGSADTQVAMGGPYEPVADSATETERLNQQALADSARALQVAEAAAVTTDEQTFETAQADEAGTQVAMGGPYEPVADDAAMNGDGSIDTAMGETAEDEDLIGV